MLPSTCPREALLACPSSPPWNLPSFTVESMLSIPCSRSALPLSRQGAALAHFDSLPPDDLVLWTDGSVPFPLGKGGSGVLVNCSLCGTEATLSFSAGQYAQVFRLKPAPFGRLFAGLGCTIKSAIFLLFSYYLTLVLFSASCPLRHVVVVVVVVVDYPTPSEGWGHGGRPWSPKSRATLQGLNQRS